MAWYNNAINNVKKFGSFIKDHIVLDDDDDDDIPSLKPDGPIPGYSGSDQSNGIEKNDMYDFYYNDYNGMTDTDRRTLLGAQIGGSLLGASLDSFGSGSAAAAPAATSGTAAAGATPVAAGSAGAGTAAAAPAAVGAGTAAAATFGSSAPSWLPTAIGTAATLGTGIITTKMGNDTAEKIANDTNAANAASVQQANETNYNIAKENLAYQRELFDYNKLLQQRIFDREDNAYQRTVNDMRKAGLSPLMMNGTNGAGEAIAQTALNNGYQAQASQYQGYQNKYYDLPILQTIMGFASGFQNLQAGSYANQRMAAESKYYSDNARLDNAQKQASLISQAYHNMDSARKEEFNKYYGLHDGMSQEEIYAAIITKMLGKPWLNSNGSPNDISPDTFKSALKEILNFGKTSSNKVFDALPFGKGAPLTPQQIESEKEMETQRRADVANPGAKALEKQMPEKPKAENYRKSATNRAYERSKRSKK